eukprot:CAMPEP_0204615088 /NCGR_PEP_ID=MMETSP0717-20131115/2675_1 /ASSEMBLY_ACC=CAM_ASM_000666 /TAXON_ID=230516 /ORGANISM="Chaetoceros curvisetus" /LENGTH=397 /DNA_ID=CAMNT_0051627947 /DNA_START=90 /DNA_END=1283 /DNA_ORIENTATION=-
MIRKISDGTGDNAYDYNPENAPHRTITNILKIHLFAGGEINGNEELSAFDDQICLYEPGMGGKTADSFLRSFRMAMGSLWRQTRPMKKKLAAVYEPGDKIFVTGFSRGAASARKFCADLDREGLKLKSGEKVDVPIEFLGVYDTVSMQVWKNLGYIMSLTFSKQGTTKSNVLNENGIIAPNVKTAVHGVAMNDNRMYKLPISFNPILMGEEDADQLAKEGKTRHEIWFAGAHGDVGGNFSAKGMSDYPLEYMMEWMEKSGAKFLKPEEVDAKRLSVVELKKKLRKTPRREAFDFPAELLKFEKNPSDALNMSKRDGNTIDCKGCSTRPVFVAKNDEMNFESQVNVHESLLHHLETMKKEGKDYYINEFFTKKTPFKVVGSLGKELPEETEKLRSYLP